jgi:uncharacterized protein YcfJ
VDFENIDLISESVSKLTKQDIKVVKEQMKNLRNYYFQLRKEGKTEDEAIYIVESKVYKNGVIATQIASITGRSIYAASTSSVAVAGGAFAAPLTWVFVGVIFMAQTVSDNRKVKKGLMSKEEFKKRMKRNAAGIGCGILGSSGGAAAGFLIGSAICPGLGSAVGAIAGAITGGVLGNTLGRKTIKKLDDRVTETNARRAEI